MRIKKIRNLMILSFAVCSAACYSVSAWAISDTSVTYKDYNTGTGEVVKTSHKTITQDSAGNIKVQRVLEADKYIQEEEYTLDSNYATKSWSIKNEKDKMDYVGRREGNTLHIVGKLEGRPVDKTIDLEDDKPLFNHPKVNLSQFAISDKDYIEFWGFHKSTLKKYAMEAKKLGEETIEFNGEPIKVVKIHFSPTKGAFKKYYERTYYFRKSDGLFVKKEEDKGRSTEITFE